MCETRATANHQTINKDDSLNTKSDRTGNVPMRNASKLPEHISIPLTVIRTLSHKQEIKTKETFTKKQRKAPVQSFPLKVNLPIMSMFVIVILLVQCSPSTAATPHIDWADIFVCYKDNMYVSNGGILVRDNRQTEVIPANNATGQTRDALVVSRQRIESQETRVINGYTTNENVSSQDTNTEKIERLKDHRRRGINGRNRENVSPRGDRSSHEFVISNQRFSLQPPRLIDAQNLNENINASPGDSVMNMSTHGFPVLDISGQHHSDDHMPSACCELDPSNVSDNNERCMEEVEVSRENTPNSPSVLVITGQTFNASEHENIALTDHVTLGQTDTAVGQYNPTVYDNTESYEHVSDDCQHYTIVGSEETSNSPGVVAITGQEFLTNEEIATTNLETPSCTAVALFRPTVDLNPLCQVNRYETYFYDVWENSQILEVFEMAVEDTSNSPGVIVITGQDFYANERGSITTTDRVTHGETNTAVGLYNPIIDEGSGSDMNIYQRVAHARYELVSIQTAYNNQQPDFTLSEDVSNTPGVLVITGQDFLTNERDSITIEDLRLWDHTDIAVGLYHHTDENNEAVNEPYGELAITDHTHEPIVATAAHQLLVSDQIHVRDLQCPTNHRAVVTLSEIAVSGQHQLPNLIISQLHSNSMNAMEIHVNDPVAPQNNGTGISV